MREWNLFLMSTVMARMISFEVSSDVNNIVTGRHAHSVERVSLCISCLSIFTGTVTVTVWAGLLETLRAGIGYAH